MTSEASGLFTRLLAGKKRESGGEGGKGREREKLREGRVFIPEMYVYDIVRTNLGWREEGMVG